MNQRGANPDNWMVVFRELHSSSPISDPLGELRDVAVPIHRFNSASIDQRSWQRIWCVRRSELDEKYPLMERA